MQFAWEVVESAVEPAWWAATVSALEAVTRGGTVDVLDGALADGLQDELPDAHSKGVLAVPGGRVALDVVAYVAVVARLRSESFLDANHLAPGGKMRSAACDRSPQAELVQTWAPPNALRDSA